MKTILAATLLCFTLTISAQKTKLISATSQEWSGGVAVHHGINYYVSLEIPDTTTIPDTLWVGGNFYPIHFDKQDTIFHKIDRKHHSVKYLLTAGEAWNDMDFMQQRLKAQNDTAKKAVKKPHKEFSCAALVTYSINGVQYIFKVEKWTVLPAQNYP